MATAKLTLIGFSNYFDDFWDGLTVPEGIDKDTLINTILMNGGEFEVLYSDPEFMRFMIPKWSAKWMHTMERWAKLINVDYAPLDNYDRHEEYTDDTINQGSTTDNTTNTFTGTTEGKVSAFDSDGYQPHDHTDANNTSTLSGTANSQSTGQLHHTAYIRGNIGTMSSQNMYMQELEVLKINMYDEIANLFLAEFVVPIY